MNFFIGKFSNQYFNQIDNKFYQCNNENKLNGLKVADYVFLSPQTYKDKYIRLWKVVEITYDTNRLEVNSGNDKVKVLFEEVIEHTFETIEQLMNFKYFDLNKDIVVNCHMGTKKSFFPLILEQNFDQSQLFNESFYSVDNSREIKIVKDKEIQEERYDFQILEENGELKCIEPVFGKMPGIFRDNRVYIGRGSSKKDRSLVQFNKLIDENEIVRFDVFSIYSFYFSFYCEYSEKVNYWIFQGNPEIYDVFSALKNNDLRSWSVKSHKDKIKTGDKFILWLTGKNAGCYALGEVSSEIESFKDESDSKYYKSIENNVESEKVNISIESDFSESPFLVSQLKDLETFKNFKGGNQGTNFQATKEQFDYFNTYVNSDIKRYWLFAPGENANMWDIFYANGIMALGFDEVGDLNLYKSKEEIQKKFQELEQTTGNKMNDTAANYQFKFEVKIGDIIICKKGRSEYLGYGIVESDYFYDDTRDTFQKCRRVKWKKRGKWQEEKKDIVLKTLTDISKYPDYVKKLIELIGIENEMNTLNRSYMTQPLNQILFGAPGTGKTYNTKKLAVEIIDNKTYTNRSEINQRYDELKSTNQIHFTTFHQSMSYEDFIEGIKPITIDSQVNYKVVDGIFKTLCIDSLNKSRLNANISETETINFDFDNLYTKFLENISNILEDLEDHNELKVYSKRSYVKILKIDEDRIITIGESAKTEEPIERSKLKRIYDKFSNVNEITNIVKQLREIGTDIGWTTNYYAIFKFFKEYEEKLRLSNSKTETGSILNEKYVLIIDEINRGNVSAIFGELITLIEEDKRKGILSPKSETIEVTLPYSKDKFSVPDNLYIIGTMNTADRSVEALDTALRRRFSFTEMQPNAELLSTITFSDVDLKSLLNTINHRIELLIDKNHQIGHAYFINIENLEDLKLTFKNKIIPLLEEYFYGDFGKIGLVLGDNFIQEVKIKTEFANFYYEDKDLLQEKKVWKFTDSDTWNIDSFKSIYE